MLGNRKPKLEDRLRDGHPIRTQNPSAPAPISCVTDCLKQSETLSTSKLLSSPIIQISTANYFFLNPVAMEKRVSSKAEVGSLLVAKISP